VKDKIQYKRQRRLEVYHELRSLVDRGIKNAEDEQAYQRMIKEQNDLKADIDRLEAVDKFKTELDEVTEEERSGMPVAETRNQKPETPTLTPEQRYESNKRAIYDFWRTGDRAAFMQATAETRDLQMDVDAAGGYTVQYEQFIKEFIKLERNINYCYGAVRHIELKKARQITIPALGAEVADPTFTAEISMGNEDSSFATKQHAISVYPNAEYIQVTPDLLEDSAINLEAEVRDSLAYKQAYVKNYNIINGDGSNGPLGFMVASALGINTDRDVTFAANNAIDADSFKDAKYGTSSSEVGLHPMWWPGAEWVLHPWIMGDVSKLKDSNGLYLLQPGSIALGSPDRIEGFPVNLDHSMPKTKTTGLYLAALWNPKAAYAAVNGLDQGIRRLNEIAARSNLIEFHSRCKFGGKPVNPQAIIRLKLA